MIPTVEVSNVIVRSRHARPLGRRGARQPRPAQDRQLQRGRDHPGLHPAAEPPRGGDDLPRAGTPVGAAHLPLGRNRRLVVEELLRPRQPGRRQGRRDEVAPSARTRRRSGLECLQGRNALLQRRVRGHGGRDLHVLGYPAPPLPVVSKSPSATCSPPLS